MTFEVVAKKDFQDATRSYLLWGVTAVFVAVVALMAGAVSIFIQDLSSTRIVGAVHLAFQYIVPLIAISISFGAIVNERNSGSLKILLSLPHSREDVIIGKFLGRIGAFVVPLLAAMTLFAVGLIVADVAFDVPFEPVKYIGFVVMTAVFGITYVAIATGVSATFDSRFWVLAVLLAYYFLFNILWALIRGASFFVLLTVQQQWPSWMPVTYQEADRIFQLMSPTGDYAILKRALFNDGLYATGVQGAPSLKIQLAATGMLVAWILLPLGVGLFRFTEADL